MARASGLLARHAHVTRTCVRREEQLVVAARLVRVRTLRARWRKEGEARGKGGGGGPSAASSGWNVRAGAGVGERVRDAADWTAGQRGSRHAHANRGARTVIVVCHRDMLALVSTVKVAAKS